MRLSGTLGLTRWRLRKQNLFLLWFGGILSSGERKGIFFASNYRHAFTETPWTFFSSACVNFIKGLWRPKISVVYCVVVNDSYDFPPIFKIWKANHPLKMLKSDVFLSSCQFILGQNVQSSDRENLSTPNYSKFAIECDWNRKIHQNVWNLVFIKRNDIFFGRIEFSQNR